ncbi:MAG: RNA methyltransferase [Parafilimonas sp.]
MLQSLRGVKGFDENAFAAVHENGERITSIRINPAKASIEKILLSLNSVATSNDKQQTTNDKLSPVPWCPHGFYLNKRPAFTFDPLLHAGAYYVQEASSMVLWEVLKQIMGNNKNQLRVLDACAAPGGKTTLLSSFFTDGLIVSNEVIKSRVNILVENITKWGQDNVVITNNDPNNFSRLYNYFDVIVVDAPCSGSGLFRKDKEAIDEWSKENVNLCSLRQKRILEDIYPTLKKEGILIYSTCSYSKEENEDILDWLMDNYQLSTINCQLPTVNCQLPTANCQLPTDWGIVEVQSDRHKANGYRFFPDKVYGEGFFIAAFLKKEGHINYQQSYKELTGILQKEISVIKNFIKDEGEYFYFRQSDNVIALPQQFKTDLLLLKQHLYLRKAGVTIGSFKRKDFIPSHELAVSLLVNDSLAKVELTKEQAIEYLRKKELHLGNLQKGWVLAQYEGINLGWMKALATRINNYYPTEWRILKDTN